ncbi:MAG TPA: PHP domain-containing protein [Hyphomicrobiales bacterium]
MSYAELVAASNFSFLRGASHPEELIIQAKALGLKAMALCDRNSLAGMSVPAVKPKRKASASFPAAASS